MVVIHSRFFFCQNILKTLFNISAKSCGNPFGGFRYKCSLRFYPTKFSETNDLIFTKLHRKVDPHFRRCSQVLEFSKIITRFDCVWMQTQKSPNDPHIRIRACGCKFHHYQLIPHFKILLDRLVEYSDQKKSRANGHHFQNGHQQNQQNFNVLSFQ
jgi:hypothetical protein